MENKKTNSNILVKAENISLSFKTPQLKVDTLKERVVNLFKGKIKSKKFQVLDNVSFEIKKSESLGVIGHNGAGKSTLLRLVTGIYPPTSGKITINGSCMLLNLGAGFDMEANAIENIFLNGAILGFTRKQMKERLNSIIEFAELQEFVHMPLKNYSSGMISRLGFAIAIDVNPDLLLVDEVLSVGDANFQKKCQGKIQELKEKGISFMFVSHNIAQVKLLCEKTLWIENSKVMAYGDSADVCKQYADYCAKLQKEQQKKQLETQAKQQETTEPKPTTQTTENPKKEN